MMKIVATNVVASCSPERRPTATSHETVQYTGNVSNRLSIVFFQSSRGWRAPQADIDSLGKLGFVPAASQSDAAEFAQQFEVLSRRRGYASWELQPAGEAALNILD